MKRAIFTLAIVLLTVAAQAQTTSLKVHSNGQLSLQSATTSYGIQIPTNGVMLIQPNVTTAYAETAKTLSFNSLSKSWVLMQGGSFSSPNLHFYVLGNGHAYAIGYYTIAPGGGSGSKGLSPIDRASEMVLGMKGYYVDSNEFEGITPEELESCGNIAPEALEGVLEDMERSKTLGMSAEELKSVLPEAVRHNPDGSMSISYDAIVPVLVEAFKEQQSKIERLEYMLRGNGLYR